MLREHESVLAIATRFFDLGVVVLAGWGAHRFYLRSWGLSDSYEIALLLGALLSALIFPWFGVYRAWRGVSLLEEIRRITLAWLVVVVALVLVSYFAKVGATYSRVWGAGWFVGAWVLLIASRALVRPVLGWLRSIGYNSRRVVVVGSSKLVRQVANRLAQSKSAGLQVAGVFFDDTLNDAPTAVPHLGPIEQLEMFLRQESVDQVWLALPLSQEQQILKLVEDLGDTTVDILLVPESGGLRLLDRRISDVAGLPVLELSVSPLDGYNRLVKALEDRVLAAVILLLVSPLMLMIAIAIKLTSPGPVFFKQQRHGYNGEVIKVYKFRSMTVHQEQNGQVTQAKKDDPRVTPLGAFLRRTSLDELPQFINVLQGRMSIVGPRPHAVEHNNYYRDKVDSYMRRHKVKPGITGWAQVNGLRGETDTLEKMQKRVEYDLYYIEHWSLWLDIRIVLMTVFKGFGGSNAY
jgi:Undecaprenyl-phosphate glucose phosphotransferase